MHASFSYMSPRLYESIMTTITRQIDEVDYIYYVVGDRSDIAIAKFKNDTNPVISSMKQDGLTIAQARVFLRDLQTAIDEAEKLEPKEAK